MCVQHLPDMRIDRKRVDVMQRKQTDTLRNLDADTGQAQQFGLGAGVIHVPDSFQIDLTGRDLPGRSANVFGAVAEPHRRKVLGRARRQTLCRGNAIVYLFTLIITDFPEKGTQIFDTLGNPRDIVLLGDDKA